MSVGTVQNTSGVGGATGAPATPAAAPPSAPSKVAQTSAGVGGATSATPAANTQAALLESLKTLLAQLSTLLTQLSSGTGTTGVGGANGGPGGTTQSSGGCCGSHDAKAAAPLATGVLGVSGDALINQAQEAVRSLVDSAPAPAAAAPAPAVNKATGPAALSGSNPQSQVLNEINRIRASYGLQPVKFNATLDAAAQQHNQAQIDARKMGHIGTGDGDPGDRLHALGFTGAWGENVAVGQSNVSDLFWKGDDAEGHHQGWMNSPDHMRNILDPRFNAVGIAYGTTADGFPFWTLEMGAA